MALNNVTVRADGSIYDNVYVRVIRVWGSKREGWNALVGITTGKQMADSDVFLKQYNIHIPWDDTINPFQLIYDAIEIVQPEPKTTKRRKVDGKNKGSDTTTIDN